MEESRKGKSPSKTTYVGISGENREANKGKHTYTASITRGVPREILPFKEMIKINIDKILVYRKDASTLVKVPGRPMLGF